ncbi:hypothetical protein D7Y15_26155 [Corallococcus sp. AB030]|nr:hypothetical protein D7Y15_26155 [Corallococcus sp. AB030]
MAGFFAGCFTPGFCSPLFLPSFFLPSLPVLLLLLLDVLPPVHLAPDGSFSLFVAGSCRRGGALRRLVTSPGALASPGGGGGVALP